MTIDELLDFRATHGVFTPQMAADRGISRHRLRRLRILGHVQRVCGRTYLATRTEPTAWQRATAAQLLWPDTIACFRTAAVLHGFPIDDDDVAHVLVPDTRDALAGLEPHYWSVRPTATERRDSIVLTDRVTTLADCLGRLDSDEAWGLLAWMWTRDLICAADLREQLDERFHLYGVVRLRLMLSAVERGALSVGELRLHEFLTHWGFRGWRGDQKIFEHGRIVARVDVLFGAHRLVVEFDGAIAHGPAKRAADEARQKRLLALGYKVERVTWADLHERPNALLRRLREAVAAA